MAYHFGKHGTDLGIATQNLYLKAAKEFAKATEGNFRVKEIGNTVIKQDIDNNIILIGNINKKTIGTFYKNNNSAKSVDDVWNAAIKKAGSNKTKPKPKSD